MVTLRTFSAHVLGLALLLGSCGREEINQRQGGISGGGGYLTGDAEEFLFAQAERLADGIESMPPQVFRHLPEDWTVSRVASVIRQVRSSPDVQRSRDARELMFDYGWDDSGQPYIEALRPFFLAYGSQSALASDVGAERNLWRRLLHETSHLLGAGEQRASSLATSMLRELEEGHIACAAKADYEISFWPGTASFKVMSPKSNSVPSHVRSLKRGVDGSYEIAWGGRCTAVVASSAQTASLDCPAEGAPPSVDCSAKFGSVDFK